MAEDHDRYLANRLCEVPAIHRAVDQEFTLRDLNRDADCREWRDCLELFGHASCDTRGVIHYISHTGG